MNPDVTQLLKKIEAGDAQASHELLPLVYDELRRLAASKMARESEDHTLQATALVHEAYLRLVQHDQDKHWDGRGHFFAAAAESMRRILVESARHKQRIKHGGQFDRLDDDLDRLTTPESTDPLLILCVHESLDRLSARSPRKAELVKLRFFAGLTMIEAAEILGIAHATAEDDWTYIRAWMRREWLKGQTSDQLNEF